jgi:hypothetical protein
VSLSYPRSILAVIYWCILAVIGWCTLAVIHWCIVARKLTQWNQIFKDPLTTAAAIDRVVHHSRIIEFGAEMTSVRAEAAAQRQLQELVHQPSDQESQI